jgi:hypothetical protein
MTMSAWTKSEIAQNFSQCATLRDIITRLEADYSAKGEVICEISVNGLVLNENDEMMFAGSSREEIFELAIQTNKPSDLITQALRSVVDMVPQLESCALITSEYMRAGEKATAAKKFDETIDGCQWMVETLVHVRGAASGIGAPIKNVEEWTASEKMITKVINELSDAYTRSDLVLVSDLLEYELTAALQSWKSTMDSVMVTRAA